MVCEIMIVIITSYYWFHFAVAPQHPRTPTNQTNSFFVIFTATNAIETEKESSNLVHPISFTLYHIIIFNINASPLLVNLGRKDDPCKRSSSRKKISEWWWWSLQLSISIISGIDMMWYGNDDRNTTALTTVTASVAKRGRDGNSFQRYAQRFNRLNKTLSFSFFPWRR